MANGKMAAVQALSQKQIRGWQLALAVILGIAIIALVWKILSRKGIVRHIFDTFAGGVGWLGDKAEESIEWWSDGFERMGGGMEKWFDETF